MLTIDYYSDSSALMFENLNKWDFFIDEKRELYLKIEPIRDLTVDIFYNAITFKDSQYCFSGETEMEYVYIEDDYGPFYLVDIKMIPRILKK